MLLLCLPELCTLRNVFSNASTSALCPADQKYRIIQGSYQLFFLSQNHKASIIENKHLKQINRPNYILQDVSENED